GKELLITNSLQGLQRAIGIQGARFFQPSVVQHVQNPLVNPLVKDIPGQVQQDGHDVKRSRDSATRAEGAVGFPGVKGYRDGPDQSYRILAVDGLVISRVQVGQRLPEGIQAFFAADPCPSFYQGRRHRGYFVQAL